MSDRKLFGFDRLAHALHKGNVGIRTGSTARAGGKTHLFSRETGRTACGLPRGEMSVTLVPESVDEESWPVRIVLCRSCQHAVKRCWCGRTPQKGWTTCSKHYSSGRSSRKA